MILVYVQLQVYRTLAHRLIGRYEGAANVLALHKRRRVGDAALHRIAQRRVKSGIRYAAYNVRIHGMQTRQGTARILAPLTDAYAVNNTVRTSKVDVLKYAARRLGRGLTGNSAQTVLVDKYGFARLYVADKLRAYTINFGSVSCMYLVLRAV